MKIMPVFPKFHIKGREYGLVVNTVYGVHPYTKPEWVHSLAHDKSFSRWKENIIVWYHN